MISMTIKVDEDKCIGCGSCESICGKIFDVRGGKAKVKVQKELPCVNQAIQSCPVQAISK